MKPWRGRARCIHLCTIVVRSYRFLMRVSIVSSCCDGHAALWICDRSSSADHGFGAAVHQVVCRHTSLGRRRLVYLEVSGRIPTVRTLYADLLSHDELLQTGDTIALDTARSGLASNSLRAVRCRRNVVITISNRQVRRSSRPLLANVFGSLRGPMGDGRGSDDIPPLWEEPRYMSRTAYIHCSVPAAHPTALVKTPKKPASQEQKTKTSRSPGKRI
jgi:hypothetical protein